MADDPGPDDGLFAHGAAVVTGAFPLLKVVTGGKLAFAWDTILLSPGF